MTGVSAIRMPASCRPYTISVRLRASALRRALRMLASMPGVRLRLGRLWLRDKAEALGHLAAPDALHGDRNAAVTQV